MRVEIVLTPESVNKAIRKWETDNSHLLRTGSKSAARSVVDAFARERYRELVRAGVFPVCHKDPFGHNTDHVSVEVDFADGPNEMPAYINSAAIIYHSEIIPPMLLNKELVGF